MVSDVAKLTKTLRSNAEGPSLGSSRNLRSKLQADRAQIDHLLETEGEAIFEDGSGKRFLLKRQVLNR